MLKKTKEKDSNTKIPKTEQLGYKNSVNLWDLFEADFFSRLITGMFKLLQIQSK